MKDNIYKDIQNKVKSKIDTIKLKKDSDGSIYHSCPYIDDVIERISNLDLKEEVYENIVLNLEKIRRINELLRANTNEDYENLHTKYSKLEDEYSTLEKEKNDFIKNYGNRHYYSLDRLGDDLLKEISELKEEVDCLRDKYE